MATKIVTKNSSTASAVPTASDLVQGELAVNVADKRLFTEDNTGTIVELGTNPSTIDINAGSIDGTAIGASSASTGAFTTLTATGLTVDTDTLYVDSTNNRVGVGTTSPNANLDIESSNATLHLTDSDDSTYAEVRNNGGTLTIGSDVGASAGGSSINFKVDNTERMRIDSSGNMGIGTSSPQSDGNTTNLEVSSAFGARVLIANTDTNGRKYGFYSSNSGILGLADYTASGTPTRMAIDSSGNVGIGTTSPSTKLHVNTGSAGYGLTLAASSQTSGTYQLGIDSSSNLAIFDTAASSQRFVISNQGNVGIGMTPSARLSIRPSGSGSEDSHFGFGANRDTYISTSSTGTIIFRNGSERMRIDSSGNLLVGTTSGSSLSNTGFRYINSGTSSYAEFVRTTTSDASANVYISRGNDGRALLFYRNDVPSTVGSVTLTTSSTAYNTSSDQRLKENIADADDAGSKIDAIQVRKFDWKVDGSHQDYGMIAQELVEVAPEAVTVPADSEEMMGVDYSKLVPMLIKEIQSLRNRVAQLEK